MRKAKVLDYKRALNNISFANYVSDVDLKGLYGLNQITLTSGIFAICGLNGAGKTTILSAVKDVLGIPRTRHDENKVTTPVSAVVSINNNDCNCYCRCYRTCNNIAKRSFQDQC